MQKIFVIFFGLMVYWFNGVIFPPPALALEPAHPFSHVGNPSDDYQLKSFFPLLRFIHPPTLVVFENRDYDRSNEPTTQCGDTRPTSCSTAIACSGTVSYCTKEGNVKTISSSGTCSGLDPKDPTVQGTCSYPDKNPSITVNASGTDFARDSSVLHDPTDDSYFLAFPKYQNEALRYQNTCLPDNPISCGAHNLILNRCDRIAKQLMVAYQAAETKETVEKTDEWPLGWVDWGYEANNGKTLFETWESIQSVPGLVEIARDLVNAQDEFFLNLGSDKLGQQQVFASTNAALPRLCELVRQSDSSYLETRAPWLRDLELLPLYPPSFRQGYLRTSICVAGACLPGKSSSEGQGLFADTSIRAAYAASVSDLFFSQSLATSLNTLNELADTNPLIRYALSTKPLATPSRISQALRTHSAQSKIKDFSFSTLGYVYDYLDDPKINSDGYALQPEGLSQEEGGALETKLSSVIVDFAYGLVSSALPISEHLLTIPEPLGQAVSAIQRPNYNSRDTAADLEDKYADGLSNIADGGSLFLTIGKGLAVGDARRRLAYFTCSDPQYSAPQDTPSIKDYALGVRETCFSDAPPGEEETPTEVNCDQSVPEQNLSGLNVEAGKSYTDRLFEGCVGNSAWMACHNDAIKRAKDKGVDPLFTLAIWIHESGASNYQCGRQKYNGDKFLDFGFNDDSIAENFSAQLDSFLNLPGAYTDRCGSGNNNLTTFVSIFWFGNCYDALPADQQNLVALYIDDLTLIYQVIADGVTLPTWP